MQSLLNWLTVNLLKFLDLVFEFLPRQVPDQKALAACKIISHRGEHDNIAIMENTLPAFDLAANAGVWGIECDIRWTKDLVPVISHDPSGERLFGRSDKISDLPYAELKQLLPLIPSLEELVERFGGKVHLMIEVKDEHYPDPEQQKANLKQILAGLTPGVDYHFLALDPILFQKVDFIPGEFLFPVAETNFSKLSHLSVEMNLGGLTGHFLLLGNDLKRRHELAGQKIGTGFISSRNCLFRELNRGIEWIFSNNAVKIQKIRNSYLIE
jgi:glycerophosphoryl diester phosphodiesterase